MAVNLSKKTKAELHTIVMEMLSTYDLSNKLVQSFVSKISNDIIIKYGEPLKSSTKKEQNNKGIINNFLTSLNNSQPQTRATQNIQVKNQTVAKNNTEFVNFSPEQNTNKQTSILKELLQAKKESGLLGVTSTLLKKRENDKGESTSYLKDLKLSTQNKGILEGIKSVVNELTKTKNKITNTSNSNVKNDVLKQPLTPVKPGEQQLDLIKDEQITQQVIVNSFSQQALTELENIIQKKENNFTDFKKDLLDSLKKTNPETSNTGGLLRFLSDIKSFKDIFKSGRSLPTPTSTRKKTSSKTTSTPSSKAGTKTTDKKALKAGAKEALETGVKTTDKKALKAGAKEALETEVKTTGKKALKAGAKEALETGAKGALETGAKTTGKKALETGAKTTGKKVLETGAKTVGKKSLETGAKTLGKSILKKIPGVGLVAGIGSGAQRALQGDWLGAGLELASGAASTIPGFGTAASLGLDAALAGRDIYKSVASEEQPVQQLKNNQTTETTITPKQLQPVETPQNWRPINEPTPIQKSQPAETPLLPTLEKIASNTSSTNNQIAALAQAIKMLAGAISNNQPTSQPQLPLILNQPQPVNESPLSQIAATNMDPIRAVRSNFAAT